MKQMKGPSTSAATRALHTVPWLLALCLPLVVDANTSGNLAYCLLWAFSALGLAAMLEAALAKAGTAPWKTVFFDDVQKYAVGATQVGMHGRVFTTVEQLTEDLAKLGFKAS